MNTLITYLSIFINYKNGPTLQQMVKLIFYLFYIFITLFLRTLVHIKILITDKILV